MMKQDVEAVERSLAEARKADDDWTAVAAKEERKKIQNRLNQRARSRLPLSHSTIHFGYMKSWKSGISHPAMQFRRSEEDISEFLLTYDRTSDCSSIKRSFCEAVLSR